MIKIICVGKIKEKYLQDAMQEYEKRITKYTKLQIIEVPDESFNDTNKVLNKEAESILKHLNAKDYIITLEINAKELTSLELAEKLDKILTINSNIVFIIGSSYGLSNKVLERATEHFSFSKLTFPHQLFRVLLLEQIYRCYKINNNEEYHK